MFGKKLKSVFNPASGASSAVKSEWVYRTHPGAAEALDAAAARVATAKDMADFIEVFSKTAARQHYHENKRDMGKGDVYVATRDFTLKPLYGAPSIKIIIPKGVTVTLTQAGLGHSDVYDMNDATEKGNHGIDIYRDVGRLLKQRGCIPRDYVPPPPPPPDSLADLAKRAADHATNGLPQAITVRRISLKPKAS